MPMIATTIISSISVKPRWIFFIWILPRLVNCQPSKRPTRAYSCNTHASAKRPDCVLQITPAGRILTGFGPRVPIFVTSSQPRPPRTGSGPVPGDRALVDLIDLLPVEEHLGIALVHLAPDEHVEQVGIHLAVFLPAARDLERLGQRLALLVGPVLRRQGLEDVGDTHAPRL